MPFIENSVLKMEKQFYEFIVPESKYGSPTLPALSPKFLLFLPICLPFQTLNQVFKILIIMYTDIL